MHEKITTPDGTPSPTGLSNALNDYVTSYTGWGKKAFVGHMNFLNRELQSIDDAFATINGNNELVGALSDYIDTQVKTRNIRTIHEKELEDVMREVFVTMLERARKIENRHGYRLTKVDRDFLLEHAIGLQLNHKDVLGESFLQKYAVLKEIISYAKHHASFSLTYHDDLVEYQAYTSENLKKSEPYYKGFDEDLHTLNMSGLYITGKEEKKVFAEYVQKLREEGQLQHFVDYLFQKYGTRAILANIETLRDGVRSEKDIALQTIRSARQGEQGGLIWLNLYADIRSNTVRGEGRKNPLEGLDMDVAKYALEKELVSVADVIRALDGVFSGVDRVELARYILEFGRLNMGYWFSYEPGDVYDKFLTSLPKELEEKLRAKLRTMEENYHKRMWKNIIGALED